MNFGKLINRILKKGDGEDSPNKETLTVNKDWYSDLYESVVIQRNILFIITFVSIIGLITASIAIKYLKSNKSIEPFVIEIEERTGVPTVVDPVTIEAYSANDSIVRYFIMKYIRAREEYIPSLYRRNYEMVVRVLSTQAVYHDDYKPKFSMGNPQSPVNILGANGSRTVLLKSIVFPVANAAQVRFSIQMTNANIENKIVYLEYKFDNIKMNEDERMINPLGFVITNYKIDDEA
jgi:type IV secretion system protein VirB8